ncbi:MAG TPA: hypothetical protein VI669_07890 [Vicinamibacteria bacterium]
MPDDPEAAYYQEIEEFFVSRRGDPLTLSNADWLLIRKWRKEEVPLRIVLRGIADALDGHAHSWGRRRAVGSLAYCANEVEAARDRWRYAVDAGREPGLDVPKALERLLASLRGATGLGPAASAVASRIEADLRRATPGTLSEIEPRLAAAEGELVEAIERDGGPTVADEVGREVDALLAPYRTRMPERVLRQLRTDSRSRRLLERHSLPRLSLFHLAEALGSEALSAEGRED